MWRAWCGRERATETNPSNQSIRPCTACARGACKLKKMHAGDAGQAIQAQSRRAGAVPREEGAERVHPQLHGARQVRAVQAMLPDDRPALHGPHQPQPGDRRYDHCGRLYMCTTWCIAGDIELRAQALKDVGPPIPIATAAAASSSSSSPLGKRGSRAEDDVAQPLEMMSPQPLVKRQRPGSGERVCSACSSLLHKLRLNRAEETKPCVGILHAA